jgi:ribosomal protein L40E
MAFIRRQTSSDGTVKLTLVEEVYDQNAKRGKTKVVAQLGEEQPLRPASYTEETVVVWAKDRTMGNVCVFSDRILGHFPLSEAGCDAILPCDIVEAGKFRHGARRWWCRTHHVYWGKKADLQALATSDQSKKVSCSNAYQPMCYVKNPLILDLGDYPGGVGIWASLPPAISTVVDNVPYTVGIHLHARKEKDGKKNIDKTFPVLLVLSKPGLFPDLELRPRIAITPPAALAYLEAVVYQRSLDCLICNRCHAPHLDLGDFAKNPHRKHFCSNCGHDGNWSKQHIVSSPLKQLHDVFLECADTFEVEKTIDLADVEYDAVKIWPSTPAIVWTLERPQEVGIHVHAYNNGQKVLDDTFGSIRYEGKWLDRNLLLQEILKKANNAEWFLG